MVGKLEPEGWVLARTPLFPVQKILDLGACCGSSSATAEERIQRVNEDVALMRSWIATTLEDPVVREALFVASPDLLAAESLWRQDPDGKKGRRFENAVYRYLQRMATRCTPYGLFAGISLGSVGEGQTEIQVGSPREHQKCTRFDMDYLCLLCEHLIEDPEVRQRIRWRTNDSAHQVGDKFVYVGHDIDPEARVRSYRLRDAAASDAVVRVIEAARSPLRLQEIAAIFDGDADNNPEEAMAFVDQAATAQILLPELWPIVSGDHPVRELVKQLRDGGCGEHAEALEQAQTKVDALDAAGPGVSPRAYQDVAEYLRSNYPSVKAAIEKLFQVDLKVSAKVHLNQNEIQAGIDEAMAVIAVLEENMKSVNPMADFIEAFRERYEEREVPLLEVLDEEHGIGPSGKPEGYIESELLAGLALSGEPQPEGFVLDPIRRLKHRLLLDSATNGFQPIQLDAATIRKELNMDSVAGSEPNPPLPMAFLMVQAAKEGLVFHSVQAGLEILGRFAGMDDSLLARIKDCAERMEAATPGVTYVQIVHHPGGRVGNILLRPRLRRKELLYLGRTDAPEADCVRAADLLVSVRDGRVVLRDCRTNEFLVPVQDNAHNVSKSAVGAYRFLNQIRHQDLARRVSGWFWGAELEGAARLPRVTAGRAILEPATWNIRLEKGADLPKLGWVGMMAWAERFRVASGLPQVAVLADSDNQLLVDFRNPMSVSAFIAAIGSRKQIRLQEWIAPAGQHANELLIAYSSPACEVKADLAGLVNEEAPGPSEERRVFEPGSEWLYLKVYAAPSVQDRVVRERLGPLAQDLQESSGLVDKWFFIRYQDKGGPHLRIRFHLVDPAMTGRVLWRVRAAIDDLLTSGTVRQMVVDTYRRELERYALGQGVMGASESLFCVDSELVCQLAQIHQPEERWKGAVLCLDWYLRQFRISETERLSFVNQARDGYIQEYRLGTAEKQRPLGDFFRKYRPNGIVPAGLSRREETNAAFQAAETRLQPLWNVYSQCSPSQIKILLNSYIHMTMNRLFYSDQRAHEMAIYAYLARAMESVEARKKKNDEIRTA